MITLVGVFSIVAGLAVTLAGIGTMAALFSGGSAPLGGVALYLFAILVVGPILVLAGPAVIFSAFKLMSGHVWARWVLETFWWLVLAAATSYLAYSGFTRRYILMEHVIEGAIFFCATGVPAIVMIVLLRSESIRRALSR